MRFLISAIKIAAIAVLTLIVLVGTRAAYEYASDRQVKPTGETIVVTIAANESDDVLAKDLKAKGLISNPTFFRLYVFVNRKGDKIQAGTYPFRKGMSTSQIINQVTGKTIVPVVPAAEVTVLIREGTRMEEIPGILKEAGMATASADFLNAAKTGKWDYDFLKTGAPAGNIEGFLFPDTYKFTLTTDAQTVIKAMLDNYGQKLQQVKNGLPADRRNALPMGVGNDYQVLIVASIVEREAASDADRPDIASVYLNRLSKKPQPMRLQADPTVQYAVGADGNWWRKIGPADLEVDNPYNTYKNGGVPPTPICSPGLKSLRAAYAPNATDYLYFVAKNDGSGMHAFAKTNDEQNANIAKYANKP